MSSQMNTNPPAPATGPTAVNVQTDGVQNVVVEKSAEMVGKAVGEVAGKEVAKGCGQAFVQNIRTAAILALW